MSKPLAGYIDVTEEEAKQMDSLWMAFNALETATKKLLVESRETAIFATKLEEAFMWATRALAIHGSKKS